MSPLAVSPGVSRALAFGLAALVVAVFARGVVYPVWRLYADNRAEVAQQRDHIVRFTRLAASLGPLRREVARVEKALAASRQILQETNPTFAAASLQERVKKVVGASGGKLASTQVLPVVGEGAFTRVTVAVRMTVTGEALQRVLHDLEGGKPYLSVEKIMVIARQARRPRVRRGRRAPTPPPEATTRTMDVRFNLSGYLRPAEDRV